MRSDYKLDLALIAIVGLAAMLRIALCFLIPPFPATSPLPGYNDEPLHLNYIRHLAVEGTWPIRPEGYIELQDPTAEFVQPPLYYAIAATVWKLFEALKDGSGLYGARLVSIVMGILTGIFAYRIGCVWSGTRSIGLGALAAVSFAPASIIFSTLVTNDAGLMLFSTLALYGLTLIQRGRGGVAREALTGGFIAAAIWSKLSGFALMPLIWFAAVEGSATSEKWRSRFRTAAVALMLTLPLLTWNHIHYGHIYPGAGGSMASAYSPEAAAGVREGAFFHPVPAFKYWVRSAAVPFDALWGSALEKIVSSLWILGAVTLTAAGIWKSLVSKPNGWLFVAAIMALTAGFVWRSLWLFQVEFRLYAPVFTALGVVAARGAEALKIPFAVQTVWWVFPILFIIMY